MTVEIGKHMSLNDFDWDDSLLIKEYDRIMQTTKKAVSKNKGKKTAKKEKTREKEGEKEPWKVGDYCRAVYDEDGLFYEATIVEIDDEYCTIEFLGYNDTADAELSSLRESRGQKARQKQRRKAQKCGDSYTSEAECSHSEANEMPSSIAAVHQGCDTNVQHSPVCTGRPFNAEQNYQPFIPYNAPPPCKAIAPSTGHNLPLPPPMPSHLSLPHDSSLPAMLAAWYMAGYYTGLHQNQQDSHHTTRSNCCDSHHHRVPPPQSCCTHHHC